MAHSGFLKPTSKPLIRAGFLWGFLCGACLIMGIWWLENTRYGVANHLVANLTRLFWHIVVSPAAILASLFGIALQTHPDLAEIGDVVFIIVIDGIVFGIAGAVVGWRFAEARFKAEFPQPSKNEEMFSKGVPVRTIYWNVIWRRGAWGILLGFILNSVMIGVALATSGGHSVSGLVLMYLCWPTAVLLQALGWSISDINMKLVLVAGLLNPILIGLLSAFLAAIMEIWLFFRKG